MYVVCWIYFVIYWFVAAQMHAMSAAQRVSKLYMYMYSTRSRSTCTGTVAIQRIRTSRWSAKMEGITITTTHSVVSANPAHTIKSTCWLHVLLNQDTKKAGAWGGSTPRNAALFFLAIIKIEDFVESFAIAQVARRSARRISRRTRNSYRHLCTGKSSYVV